MGQVEMMVDGIINEINQELNAKDELLTEFENFADKVYTKEGKLSVARTITAMVKAGVIEDTKENPEAKLLRKYSSELFVAPEGKTKEELEDARRDEKMRLLTAVEACREAGQCRAEEPAARSKQYRERLCAAHDRDVGGEARRLRACRPSDAVHLQRQVRSRPVLR
jgi:hypothetical protein